MAPAAMPKAELQVGSPLHQRGFTGCGEIPSLHPCDDFTLHTPSPCQPPGICGTPHPALFSRFLWLHVHPKQKKRQENKKYKQTVDQYDMYFYVHQHSLTPVTLKYWTVLPV